MSKEIVLANPRGFCAGVDRAIDIVEKSLEKFDQPVFVRHQVVHNKKVVEDLEKKGVKFVKEIEEIPDNAVAIFSAHGVSKSVEDEARNRKFMYFDATCPLVTKVHLEVQRHARKGRDIVLIGHKGHPEVIGTLGRHPEDSDTNIYLVENYRDIKELDINSKEIAYVTQTTLSVDDTKEIILALKKKFPEIKEPKKEDICYATTNRQAAVKKIAEKCDMFFVIGSRNSSNSLRLVEVAKNSGCTNSRLIHSESDVPFEEIEKYKTIGISSGASAPEILVYNFINNLKKQFTVAIEEIEIVKENITFKIPGKLN